MQDKKIYLVGGAVRDSLLGRPVHDKDYVCVGYTHEEMIAAGFTQVGANFAVYLHPETKEEYALARTERKVGDGHTGFETFFSPDVTLEEDLSRRDLTINAMAQDIETGEYIDPFKGLEDILNKTLRHTTEAFMDDPLRILRLFRLKAQLGEDWQVAHQTYTLVKNNSHRLAEISPERKWKEMEKALNSNCFHNYAYHLSVIGELPELNDLRGVEQPREHHPEGDAFIHTLMCLQKADKCFASPMTKFAVLCHDFGKATTFKEFGNLIGHEEAGVPLIKNLCNRIRVPNEYRDAAMYVAENHTRVHSIVGRGENKGAKPRSVMKIFEKAGSGFNTEKVVEKVLTLADACWCDARGRGKPKGEEEYTQGHLLLEAFDAMRFMDTKRISGEMLKKGKSGKDIGEAIRVARIDKIRNVMRYYNEAL